MNRRQVIGAGAVGLIGMVGAARTQQPDPTVAAIRTQIAGLEATLTAIPTLPGGTPTEVTEFNLTGEAYALSGESTEVVFHIEVRDLLFITGPIHHDLYDTTISPNGKFVAIEVIVTNLESVPMSTWPSQALRLRDNQGRVFTPNWEASNALTSNRDLYVLEWQPDVAYDDVVAWDVALDAEGFGLMAEGTNVVYPLS